MSCHCYLTRASGRSHSCARSVPLDTRCKDEIDEPSWEHLGSREEFERKIIKRMEKIF
jgi:hypothetical protein